MDNWSDEETFKLIDLYREEESLWKIDDFNYHNKDKRANAFGRIATALENKSVKEVQKKLKTMRTYYVSQNSKISSSLVSSAGVENVYQPKWPYFAHLSFLKDQITPRRSVSNLQSSGDNDSGNEESESPISKQPKRKAAERLQPKHSKKIKSEDLLIQEVSTTLQRINNQTTSTEKKVDDDIDQFGRMIASELRLIDDKKERQLLKKKLQKVLFEGPGDDIIINKPPIRSQFTPIMESRSNSGITLAGYGFNDQISRPDASPVPYMRGANNNTTPPRIDHGSNRITPNFGSPSFTVDNLTSKNYENI